MRVIGCATRLAWKTLWLTSGAQHASAVLAAIAILITVRRYDPTQDPTELRLMGYAIALAGGMLIPATEGRRDRLVIPFAATARRRHTARLLLSCVSLTAVATLGTLALAGLEGRRVAVSVVVAVVAVLTAWMVACAATWQWDLPSGHLLAYGVYTAAVAAESTLPHQYRLLAVGVTLTRSHLWWLALVAVAVTVVAFASAERSD